MLKNSYPGTLETEPGITIGFTTNFPHDKIPIDKPLLVFNYGLVCNVEHWREQVPYFDQLGYPLVIHDYRGHFLSSLPDNIEEITFERISYDILKLVDHLRAEKTVMLGHSMGVNICLECVKDFPEKIIGQVLISGTVVPPQGIMFDNNTMDIIQPYLEWFTASFPKVLSPVWKYSYKNPLIRKIIHRGGFNTKTVPDEFVHIYMKKIGELPPELFFQLINQMRTQDILNQLESMETPSLIVGGDKDKVIPNYLQVILQKYLKASQLYIVKDGSHVPQVDFPATINERIAVFLEGLV